MPAPSARGAAATHLPRAYLCLLLLAARALALRVIPFLGVLDPGLALGAADRRREFFGVCLWRSVFLPPRLLGVSGGGPGEAGLEPWPRGLVSAPPAIDASMLADSAMAWWGLLHTLGGRRPPLPSLGVGCWVASSDEGTLASGLPPS